MFSQAIATVYFALSVTATVVVRDSPITVQLARHFNATGAKKILEADQDRVRFLKGHADRNTAAPGSVPAINNAVSYTTNVQVGDPPATYSLIVDTGSSNTWVGANSVYMPTRTSNATGQQVVVVYGSGFFVGNEFIDQVSLGAGLTATNQSIGVAVLAFGFQNVDGILGIGPTGLTVGTTIPDKGAIPTTTDTLSNDGAIPARKVGVFFQPTSSAPNPNGELTFGGIDTSKIVGGLHTFPITSTSPASNYVGLNQTITYGSPTGQTVLANAAGIADTGTTLTLIASDAFATYQQITGGVPDETTSLLKITPAQFAALKSLFFNVGDQSFELTPNAQIWPRALNAFLGGDANSIYLIIGNLSTPSGQGLDFINGQTFLERYYLAYDSEASQVGFGQTPFTFATTN